MRLMFVITRGDSIGGAQIHVRDLARRLVADGHEVRVVTGAFGPLTEALAASGIESESCSGLLREIHPYHDLRAVAALRRSIRGFRPDLVSTHSSKAGTIGRLAGRLASAPTLFTAHGWAFTEGVPQPRRTVYRTVERLTAPLAARIICVSEQDRRLALAAGISSSRVVTVHNGMPDIPQALRARPGEGERPRLVMVARFDRQKDHRTLFLALRGVAGAELDLVGDGPGEAAAQHLASELGIANRVRFLGRRTDVAEILSQTHIFVLSSNWEGFPRSTLEAMRAGLPVVVSDVGGAGEAVEDGVTGYLVARGDVDGLRTRLLELVGDTNRRAAMGAAGRARYEREFTFDEMYRKTLAVYESVLNDGKFQRKRPTFL